MQTRGGACSLEYLRSLLPRPGVQERTSAGATNSVTPGRLLEKVHSDPEVSPHFLALDQRLAEAADG
jgi:hypothetical protein